MKVWGLRGLPLYMLSTWTRGVETCKHKHKGDSDSRLNRVLETESFLLAVSGGFTVCFLAAIEQIEGLRGYSAVIKAEQG